MGLPSAPPCRPKGIPVQRSASPCPGLALALLCLRGLLLGLRQGCRGTCRHVQRRWFLGPARPRRVPEEVDERSEERDDEYDDEPEQLAGEPEIAAADDSDGDEQPDEDPCDDRCGGEPRTEGVGKRRHGGRNLPRTMGALPKAEEGRHLARRSGDQPDQRDQREHADEQLSRPTATSAGRRLILIARDLFQRLVPGHSRGPTIGLVRLWCQECGRPSSPDAKGWRLYRTDDEDEFEVTTLAAYCPGCAARELGLERRERRESD